MQKTERMQNIKFDVHAPNFDPDNSLMSAVRRELRNLMRIYGNIVGADFYLLEDDPEKKARIRLGLPGRNLIAEAESFTWLEALREASGELRDRKFGHPIVTD